MVDKPAVIVPCRILLYSYAGYVHFVRFRTLVDGIVTVCYLEDGKWHSYHTQLLDRADLVPN